MSSRRKEKDGMKSRRHSCGKTEIDVDPHKVAMSYEDEDCSLFSITCYPCIN
jgi:hypothetical protein